LLRGVVAGYETTKRINLALGPRFRDARGSRMSSHAVGGAFGAAAAAAVVLGCDSRQVRHVLSYVSHLASGTTAWIRDPEHVQKAFVFGGMPAGHGVLAAELVVGGLPGIDAIFDSVPNFLDAFGTDVDDHWLTEPWGSTFAVAETNFKLHPVGSPAQALVQAAEQLASRVRADEISSATLYLPPETAHVVQNPGSPNLNAAFLVAVALCDGQLTFVSAHDSARPSAPPYAGLVDRIRIATDERYSGTRGGRVEVSTVDGRHEVAEVRQPLGTLGAPLPESQVLRKAQDLFECRYPAPRARELCEAILSLRARPHASPVLSLMQ
jgi:2-methylcitrate dehydratase PrpD